LAEHINKLPREIISDMNQIQSKKAWYHGIGKTLKTFAGKEN